MNYLSRSALKTATGWVKKESEKEPDNAIPKGYEPAEGAVPELVGEGAGRGGWGLKKQ
jgi:hypothetical protein